MFKFFLLLGSFFSTEALYMSAQANDILLPDRMFGNEFGNTDVGFGPLKFRHRQEVKIIPTTDAVQIPGSVWTPSAPDLTTNSDAHATTAFVQALLPSIPVERFGGKCDGVTDNLPAYNAAKAAFPSGMRLKLPAGVCMTSGPFDRSGRSGIYIEGAGRLATILQGDGNFPIIQGINTRSTITNGNGVNRLTLKCAGKELDKANGLKVKYENESVHEDIRVLGCNHAFDFTHIWQVVLNNFRITGSGTEQNNIGIYMDASTGFPNEPIDNGLIASDGQCQYVATGCYRLVNFQGSKFTNVEAGGGIYGWYLCDGTDATIPCQWGHFANIQADTISGLWSCPLA
ncbi:hypothetical protein, partial [Methylobacterium dankookense]